METNQTIDNGSIDAATMPIRTEKNKADLRLTFEVSVNAQFGTSAANQLIFALMGHRELHLNELMKCLADGDYSSAHQAYNDLTQTFTLIDEFAMSLSALADHNFWAAEMPHSEEYIAKDHAESFMQFLKTCKVDASKA